MSACWHLPIKLFVWLCAIHIKNTNKKERNKNQQQKKKQSQSSFPPPPLTGLHCFFTPVHAASFQQRRAELARRSHCCYPSLWQLQYDWLTQPPLLQVLPLPLPCVWPGLGADDGSVGGALGLVSPLPKRNVVFGGRRGEGKAGNDTEILERWQVEREGANLVLVWGPWVRVGVASGRATGWYIVV